MAGFQHLCDFCTELLPKGRGRFRGYCWTVCCTVPCAEAHGGMPIHPRPVKRRQMAPRADCGRTFTRSQDHFDVLLVGTQTGVLIDRTSETMAAVQDRGQFHGGETSTINRRQTHANDFGKPYAARQDLSPSRADSDDHPHQSPRRRQLDQVDCRSFVLPGHTLANFVEEIHSQHDVVWG